MRVGRVGPRAGVDRGLASPLVGLHLVDTRRRGMPSHSPFGFALFAPDGTEHPMDTEEALSHIFHCLLLLLLRRRHSCRAPAVDA